MNGTLRRFKTRDEFVKFVSSSKKTISKNDLICDLCRDKDVLDLGCIDHSYKTALMLGDDWLHKRLKGISRSIVGVDILKDDIRELNNQGFNILEANVESIELKKTFDVIVAGDLIEHLTNIGLFLACVERHMHSQSVCVITTPNPFNIEQTMWAIFDNQISVNKEHTTWLDPRVMYETISRSGLEIVGFYWIETRFKMPVRRVIFRYIAKIFAFIIMKIRPICRRDYAIITRKKEI